MLTDHSLCAVVSLPAIDPLGSGVVNLKFCDRKISRAICDRDAKETVRRKKGGLLEKETNNPESKPPSIGEQGDAKVD